jgi:hypothetical protein
MSHKIIFTMFSHGEDDLEIVVVQRLCVRGAVSDQRQQ